MDDLCTFMLLNFDIISSSSSWPAATTSFTWIQTKNQFFLSRDFCLEKVDFCFHIFAWNKWNDHLPVPDRCWGPLTSVYRSFSATKLLVKSILSCGRNREWQKNMKKFEEFLKPEQKNMRRNLKNFENLSGLTLGIFLWSTSSRFPERWSSWWRC